MKLLNLDSTHEKSRCLERRQVSFQQGLKVSSLFLIVRMDGAGTGLETGKYNRSQITASRGIGTIIPLKQTTHFSLTKFHKKSNHFHNLSAVRVHEAEIHVYIFRIFF